MIESLEKTISQLKKEFSKTYSGSSHIQEIIPDNVDLFEINKKDLQLLHLFAKNNPVYYSSYDDTILNIPCTVYEGDINEYWLNSIQHSSSHAPFSPTWIISAYVASLQAKELGYSEIVDIGSGDGRIAYCAKILDVLSYSVEIDQDLVNLQKDVSDSTGIFFNSECYDATKFDYSAIKLTKPAFFIGGLAKMGGDRLASDVIAKIPSQLRKSSCMVFVGTLSPKYSSDNMEHGGWAKIIEENNLHVIKTVTLPTVWTFKEPHDTPYVFAKFS